MAGSIPVRRSAAAEFAAMLGTLGLVCAAAAFSLRALDGLPQWLAGMQPGIERFQSLEAAERTVGIRAFLPAYFPDTLHWPPGEIVVSTAPPPVLAVAFAGHDGARRRLVICLANAPHAAVPSELMPAGRVLHRTDVPMPDGEAVLLRVQMENGAIGNDLVWYRAGETIALRYLGPAEQLVAIARSLRRRRP